ncbi:hypothetical protein D0C36_22875 [Mucilaginibacter conchicola]|uniref:HD domain-containing protein n=1 Tax=Mucilaginibacter conchicola TaxID=2303333 RepID=A0A372NMK4_9SPHI|nr:hypothetical protein [Mucilaginibacter conchicola]RFZ90088.1 hypothetical protein D0C36_22875 [Mucilaginibacter conchicola]
MGRQKDLLHWINQQHAGQIIRKTNTPYVDHLKAVGQMASIIPYGYEIGLCHDLFEKTKNTTTTLSSALSVYGYNTEEIGFIVHAVTELTTVFTKRAYPHLNKKTRKKLEAKRLVGISSSAQTVKYADLAYNISWMLKHQRKDLPAYLEKKRLLVLDMTEGIDLLRTQVLQIINEAVNSTRCTNVDKHNRE